MGKAGFVWLRLGMFILLGLVFSSAIPVQKSGLPARAIILVGPKIDVIGMTTVCGEEEWKGVELVIGRASLGGELDSMLVDYAAPYIAYQWYRDGELLPGEQDSVLKVTETGLYGAEVFTGYEQHVMEPFREPFWIDTLIEVRKATEKPSVDWMIPFPVSGICRGATATIGIEPLEGVEYIWRKADGTIDTLTTNSRVIAEAGVYEVNIRNACGESPGWKTIRVEEFDLPPEPVVDSVFFPCGEGDAYIALADEVLGRVTWLDENRELIRAGSAPWLSYAITGDTRVYAGQEDENGCHSQWTPVDLQVREVAPVRIGSFIISYLDRLVVEPEEVPSVGTYRWLPEDGCLSDAGVRAPVFSALGGKTAYRYCLEYTAPNGCVSEDSTLIEVVYSCKFPEVITPNGDGYNDFWVIEGLEGFPDHKVEIYDRQGKKVFSASPYHNDWDGHTDGGKLLPSGAYLYQVSGIEGRTFRGMVSIIRN